MNKSYKWILGYKKKNKEKVVFLNKYFDYEIPEVIIKYRTDLTTGFMIEGQAIKRFMKECKIKRLNFDKLVVIVSDKYGK